MKGYLILVGLIVLLTPAYAQKISSDSLSKLVNRQQKILFEYRPLKIEGDKLAKETILSPEKSLFVKEAQKKLVIKTQKLNKEFVQNLLVIYGPNDNKKVVNVQGVYKVTETKLTELRKGVVAIIHSSNIDTTGGKFKIMAPLLKNTKKSGCLENMCTNIPDGNEHSAVMASGFILTRNRILTTNHRMDDDKINQFYIVTNYFQDVDELDKNNVYRITNVITKAEKDKHTDFKVLEVERPFSAGNDPLAMKDDANIVNSADIFMIGFPNGLSMTLADNAKIYGLTDSLFNANLDAFVSNSGSPVFDENGFVIGMLKGGNKDYIKKEQDCCEINSIPTNITDGMKIEKVIRLKFILPYKN